MKVLFISDIHGSIYYAQQAIEKFHMLKPDVMVLLGDILYHGPRNPLPKGYDPKSVALLLNDYKDHIVAVRGNCDSEVDQMVLDFPIMGDYHILVEEGYKIFMTHGHLFNKEKMPTLKSGDAFIHGHFHLPMAEDHEGIHYLNPGSITLPKENNPNSYGFLNDHVFEVRTLADEVIKSRRLK